MGLMDADGECTVDSGGLGMLVGEVFGKMHQTHSDTPSPPTIL